MPRENLSTEVLGMTSDRSHILVSLEVKLSASCPTEAEQQNRQISALEPRLKLFRLPPPSLAWREDFLESAWILYRGKTANKKAEHVQHSGNFALTSSCEGSPAFFIRGFRWEVEVVELIEVAMVAMRNTSEWGFLPCPESITTSWISPPATTSFINQLVASFARKEVWNLKREAAGRNFRLKSHQIWSTDRQNQLPKSEHCRSISECCWASVGSHQTTPQTQDTDEASPTLFDVDLVPFVVLLTAKFSQHHSHHSEKHGAWRMGSVGLP